MGLHYKAMVGFLGNKIRDNLLQYALTNENLFEMARVGGSGDFREDKEVRVSRRLRELGDFKGIIEQQVLLHLPQLLSDLGVLPFDPAGVEIEMVAHGDGDFYGRHIDVITDRERSNSIGDRMITVVYYFFREPRSFNGGALKLFPLPTSTVKRAERSIDIEIDQDLAVAFSSWLPHEVMKVKCPDCKFADSRFSVNCWVLRKSNDGLKFA